MEKRRGNSIIEIMVVLTILTFGLVGTYGVLNSGQKLATSTENRIKGANIAREGIEIVQNIRDSNWIKFSSDYTHCWNVKDYQSSCIGTNNDLGFDNQTSYIAYQDNGVWKLEDKGSSPGLSLYSSGYRNNFPVFLNSEGMTIQSGSIAGFNTTCNTTKPTGCKTIFSREIKISYPDTGLKTDKRMKVNSIVKWADSSKEGFYTINLETILTNWKEDL